MSTQDIINPTSASNKHQQRDYPLYTKVRMRKDNVRKIKARATKYAQSFDDIVSEMIQKVEQCEQRERIQEQLRSEKK
jgi:hypothetical protein